MENRLRPRFQPQRHHSLRDSVRDSGDGDFILLLLHPRDLPVIGPRDDVAPGVGRRLQILVARPLCGEHVIHDARSRPPVWITEASGRVQPARVGL
jgi:hypothetical protein